MGRIPELCVVVLLPTIGGGGRTRDLAPAACVSCISLSLESTQCS
jgi:hypothetical protein